MSIYHDTCFRDVWPRPVAAVAGLVICLMAAALPASASDDVAFYRIGPRDVLSIAIYAGGELQQEVKNTVNGDGSISVPFIGRTQAAGRTSGDLAEFTRAALARDFFVSPEVLVRVEEYHHLRYHISGAIASPGLYELSGEASLMTLIARAGGVLPERGNIAYIMRNSLGKVQEGSSPEALLSAAPPMEISLSRLLDQGDLAMDAPLKSGDVVYIPREKERDVGESHIYIEGEARKPGVYPYRKGLTLLNACLLAGGFTEFASSQNVRIVRQTPNGQVSKIVDLERVRSGKDRDVRLRPGDLINIPESWF